MDTPAASPKSQLNHSTSMPVKTHTTNRIKNATLEIFAKLFSVTRLKIFCMTFREHVQDNLL